MGIDYVTGKCMLIITSIVHLLYTQECAPEKSYWCYYREIRTRYLNVIRY